MGDNFTVPGGTQPGGTQFTPGASTSQANVVVGVPVAEQPTAQAVASTSRSVAPYAPQLPTFDGVSCLEQLVEQLKSTTRQWDKLPDRRYFDQHPTKQFFKHFVKGEGKSAWHNFDVGCPVWSVLNDMFKNYTLRHLVRDGAPWVDHRYKDFCAKKEDLESMLKLSRPVNVGGGLNLSGCRFQLINQSGTVLPEFYFYGQLYNPSYSINVRNKDQLLMAPKHFFLAPISANKTAAVQRVERSTGYRPVVQDDEDGGAFKRVTYAICSESGIVNESLDLTHGTRTTIKYMPQSKIIPANVDKRPFEPGVSEILDANKHLKIVQELDDGKLSTETKVVYGKVQKGGNQTIVQEQVKTTFVYEDGSNNATHKTLETTSYANGVENITQTVQYVWLKNAWSEVVEPAQQPSSSTTPSAPSLETGRVTTEASSASVSNPSETSISVPPAALLCLAWFAMNGVNLGRQVYALQEQNNALVERVAALEAARESQPSPPAPPIGNLLD